jgi:hypothetical protein
MWLAGQKNEVIRYNENDCDLTFKLWFRFVQKKKVFLKDERYFDNKKDRKEFPLKVDYLFRPTRIIIVSDERPGKMEFRSYSGKRKIPIVLKNNFYRYILGKYPMSFNEFENLTDSTFPKFFMKEES